MRYNRQILMEKIGVKGQSILKNSTVSVLGAGGLGSPVLTYLVCAGVGKIIIADSDTVSLTNLNRQFLHNEDDINKFKVTSAAEKLRKLNSDVEIVEFNTLINNEESVKSFINGSDVVVDCVDNIETRILLGRACLSADIPLVEAGVEGFYGWVTSIRRDSPCLECLGFDKFNIKKPVPIIGVTAGVVGCLEANECIKILLGLEGTLFGTLLQYDGLSGVTERVEILKSKKCKNHNSIESLY